MTYIKKQAPMDDNYQAEKIIHMWPDFDSNMAEEKKHQLNKEKAMQNVIEKLSMMIWNG